MDRRQQRVVAAVKVSLRDRPELEPCLTRDIGPGGLFLLTAERFEVGALLALRVRYRSLEVDVNGRVVHSRADGCGVFFWNPSEEVREQLHNVVLDLLALGNPKEERRRDPRLALQIPVTWRLGGFENVGDLIDLSRTGARLLTKASELSVGKEIMLSLPVRDVHRPKEMVGSRAVVWRLVGDEIGLEFVDPSPEFRACVARHQLKATDEAEG